MEKVLISGLINHNIQENGSMTLSMVRELTLGTTVENMKDHGRKISCMASENRPMKMEEPIQETTKMIRSMVKENTLGLMVKFMMEDGLTANNMEKPDSQILKARVRLVIGKMEKERNG